MGVVISKCYPNHLAEPGELGAGIPIQKMEKQCSEAVARLRRKVEEVEQKVTRLKAAAIGGGCRCHGLQLEKDYFEHMKAAQARRDEAAEKWKQLYFAIKIELDELIRRTGEGDRRTCPAEGLVAQGLLRELKAKDEALEVLGAKLAAMEKEVAGREREVDILRQSLRILTNSMGTRGRRCIKKSLHS